MKPFFLLFIITFSFYSCTNIFYPDASKDTKKSIIKLESTGNIYNAHFKNGNYIISVHDSISKGLIKLFTNSEDISILKKDTIDINLVEPYWTGTSIGRELRKCIERKEVKIYSISESKYLNKIIRRVSKSTFRNTHTFYNYLDRKKNGEILYSGSFDTGTPPF